VNYTVYYKFVAPARAKVIGAFSFSNHIGSGYRPTCRPYNSVPYRLLGGVHLISGQNKCIQFPVTAGGLYYLELLKNIDSAGPESLRIQVEVAPALGISAGAMAISDDNSGGYPIAILSTTTGKVVDFYPETVAMERGAILHLGDGEILFTDDENDKLLLFSPTLTPVSIIDQDYDHISSNKVDTFYVGTPNGGVGGKAAVTTISKIGGVGAKIWTFPSVGLTTLVPNNGETILYYSGPISSTITTIKRWDLVNDIALTDFVASLGSSYILLDEMLVLEDDSVIAGYEKTTGGVSTIIKRYKASDGSVLNTYDLGSVAGNDGRLAYALDHPNSFWVWLKLRNLAISRFMNIKVSDGSTISQFDIAQFTGGRYDPDETATPIDRFGTAESCPFLILIGTTGPTITPFSGIYFINSNKTTGGGTGKHDSYYENDVIDNPEKKIPNPIWRTAYMGE
jgi:hypothetical protein